MAGNSNTNVTIGCGCREDVETGGGALTGEASHVVSSAVWIVDTEVLRVTPAQPSDCLFNVPSMRTFMHFFYYLLCTKSIE